MTITKATQNIFISHINHLISEIEFNRFYDVDLYIDCISFVYILKNGGKSMSSYALYERVETLMLLIISKKELIIRELNPTCSTHFMTDYESKIWNAFDKLYKTTLKVTKDLKCK